MKIAYFDTIAGISGDMTLGAFVSAGVSIDELSAEITKLNLKGVELEASHVQRNGITAVKVDVIVSTSHEHHRSLSDIFKIIDSSSFSERVKLDAKKIFIELGTAEARIHNTSIEKIHFHEVGALDSIIDIVGASACFEKLGIEKVYSSPIKVGGGGLIAAEHGRLPIPTPATIEILKGYPIILTEIPSELTTPTGAAIIKAMSSGVLTSEQISVESVGYGAGAREISQAPNLLRVMVGQLAQPFEEDEVISVETNIDDMNPEIYPYVVEQLLDSGAQDAYMIPIVMKKGRSGILLSALVSHSKLDAVLKLFFTQTTTLGVRIQPIERRKVSRQRRDVQTQFGMVTAKMVTYNGTERLVPEFEECKRIATEKRIPLLQVYKILEVEFSKL